MIYTNSNSKQDNDSSAEGTKTFGVNAGVLLDSFSAASLASIFKFKYDRFITQIFGGNYVDGAQTLSFSRSTYTAADYQRFANNGIKVIYSLQGLAYSDFEKNANFTDKTIGAYYKIVYNSIYKEVCKALSNVNARASISGWFDVNGEDTRIECSMVTKERSLQERTRAGAMRDAINAASSFIEQGKLRNRTFEAYLANGWAGSQLTSLLYDGEPIYSFATLGANRYEMNPKNSFFYDWVHESALNIVTYQEKTDGTGSLTFGGAVAEGTGRKQFDNMFFNGAYLAISMGVKSICEYVGKAGTWAQAFMDNLKLLNNQLNVVEKELGWAIANGNTLAAAGKSSLVPQDKTPVVASTYNNKDNKSKFYSNEFVGRDGSLYITLVNKQLDQRVSVNIKDNINASYQIVSVNGAATGGNNKVSGGSFVLDVGIQSTTIIKFSAANLKQAMASLGSSASIGSLSGGANQIHVQSPILVGHA